MSRRERRLIFNTVLMDHFDRKYFVPRRKHFIPEKFFRIFFLFILNITYNDQLFDGEVSGMIDYIQLYPKIFPCMADR